jgi:hypothetical protein
MNEKPKRMRHTIKYPVNFVSKVPFSPRAKVIMKNKTRGMKNTIISKE